MERALILRASYATKWNQSRTAELLNLKRDKLRYRMKLYDLHPEPQHPESMNPGHMQPGSTGSKGTPQHPKAH